MIQRILELFERFVAAQEKIAEANMLLAQDTVAPVRSLNPEASAAVQNVKNAFPGTEATNAVDHTSDDDTTPPNHTGAWDPYTAPIQARYGRDKLDILELALVERGVCCKGTGVEKHQALLDHRGSSSVADTASTTQDKDGFPLDANEDAAPPAEITVDDVRQLAQKAMAAKMAAPAIQTIFEKHGGSKRLPEIPAEKLAGVHAALSKAVAAMKGA